MDKEVSVIIPTYRGSSTLGRAIDSVINQKGYDSFEIVVVDDNNPDSTYRRDTELVMEKYNDYPFVKYVKHPQNMNGAVARNTGFKNSMGEYICFLDDDDVFLPDKLRLQVQYMKDHPEFGASYTWRVQNYCDLVRYSKTGNLAKEILLLNFFPTTITIMLRRQFFERINGFDESFRRHQDFEFLLRLFKECDIGVVSKPLSLIIGKNEGTEGNTLSGKDFYDLKLKFLDKFSEEIKEIDAETPGFKKKVYASHFAEVYVSEISKGERKLAHNHFKQCFKTYGLYYCYRIVKHYLTAIRRRISGLFSKIRGISYADGFDF